MANSIVFQNSAEQLKTSIYGYDGSSYKALKVSSNGTLQTNLSGGTVKVNGGTIRVVGVPTVRVASGTVKLNGGTVKLAGGTVQLNGGTVRVVGVPTVRVESGTVKLNGGTVKLAGGTVQLNGGTVRVVGVPTVRVASGTVKLNGGTVRLAGGTTNVKLADRTFTMTILTTSVTSATPVYTALIDISKFQDTSWYIQNLTGSPQSVTAQLAVTPSSVLGSFPRVLIQQTATVVNSPVVITNDYYMKYICVNFTTSSASAQDMQVVFNGRY